MRMRLRGLVALVCLLAAGLCGCEGGPPKLGAHETLLLNRPPSLVEMAVLDCGVAPSARREAYEGGDPVDFMGAGRRVIRVSYDPDSRATKVEVTHIGFGGPKGARKALRVIEQWMKYTDKSRKAPPKQKQPPLPMPRI